MLAGLCFGIVCALPGRASAQSGRSDLTRIRQQIQAELRSRPEVVQARQDWLERQLEYRVLRRAVVNDLNSDGQYLRLRTQMWKLEDELASLAHQYRHGVVPAEQVQELAQQILLLRMQLTRLESQAIERHRDVLEAREAYVAAGRRLVELHRQMQDLLRSDPRFQRALDRVHTGGGRGGVAGAGGAGGTGGSRRSRP